MKNTFMTVIVLVMALFLAIGVFAEDNAGKTSTSQTIAVDGQNSNAGVMMGSADDSTSQEISANKAVLRYKESSENSSETQEPESIRTQTRAEEEIRTQSGKDDAAQLQQRISERKAELDDETSKENLAEQKTFKNQNGMKIAVHALLEARNYTGGIGEQVSQIAKEFDNSINKTIENEKKIDDRGNFTKALIGGNYRAAREIQNAVSANEARILILQNLIAGSDTSEDVKAVLNEQIQTLSEENARLNDVAGKEMGRTGLLGWIIRPFAR